MNAGGKRASENSCVCYIRQIGPNLYHIFGPSSGTLGPIPKKILMDNLPIMARYRSKYQPSRSNTVGGVALQR